MVKIIIGKKGTGKTKTLIDMVNADVKAEKTVVCVERGKLNLEINHGCRLINFREYPVKGYEGLIGFIAGILACNYDVTDVYIDSILKLAGFDFGELAEFIKRLEELNADRQCKFVITVSADISEVPEEIKKYVVMH